MRGERRPAGIYFYPRPPRGGRLAGPCNGPAHPAHFYPRPPRGGRPPFQLAFVVPLLISTHALREEGDPAILAIDKARQTISTHALREEGDAAPISIRSTIGNFYPRPPRGGRRLTPSCLAVSRGFLPTPSARRATGGQHPPLKKQKFLPTPSARRATASSGRPGAR